MQNQTPNPVIDMDTLSSPPPDKTLIAPGGKMKAWIEVEKHQIDLFKVEHDEGKKVSESWCKGDWGKEYTVHVKLDKPTLAQQRHGDRLFNRLNAELWIDGRLQDETSTGKLNKSRDCDPTELKFDGITVGLTEKVPMMFAKPNTNSTAQRLPADIVKDLGTIKLKITRIRFTGKSDSPPSFAKVGQNFQQINTKDKPAEEAVTDFGPKYKIAKPVEYWDSETHPDDKEDPLYTFVFKYRPTKVLEAMGIIQAPIIEHAEEAVKPEQKKVEEKDKHDNLDDSEGDEYDDDAISDDSWDKVPTPNSDTESQASVEVIQVEKATPEDGSQAALKATDTKTSLTGSIIVHDQNHNQDQVNNPTVRIDSSTLLQADPSDPEEEPLDHERIRTEPGYFAEWKEREFERMMKKMEKKQ